MEPIFNIATVLYSIEDDLSKEEFSSISNHFENLCKKTNETNDIFKKMNDYKQLLIEKQYRKNYCCCVEGEICLANSKTKLKSCKNFSTFVKKNPFLKLFNDQSTNIAKNTHLNSGASLDEHIKNIANLTFLMGSLTEIDQQTVVYLSKVDYLMRNMYILIIYQDYALNELITFQEMIQSPMVNYFLQQFKVDIKTLMTNFEKVIISKN